MSEQTGLSVDALRWYERQGVIPAPGRSSDGRRRYTPSLVRFIRLVHALRRTGMSVAEVRDFVQMDVGIHAHRPRMAILERHETAIRTRIEELNTAREVIQDKIAHHRDLLARGLDCEDEIYASTHA
ncbi:MerR family transcriptional regulator [Saccharopolyspora spinosporotrichia]|uniref:MerR-family transcriptional regulator n=1 Tax=Saccharopolyspora erythraea (strain ATCC 11635 / DSM 40517 / JCM 4748 / NBRC 13426 / NCIMB 8594 / NRRL 2338) TaxID=405948 RepID=A4FD11_SACEN|nr:MerR family transcriptional regulator [Saccharopolyspora erythraea D]QRK93524.1 MerR family transcriptional regulator [Saccharopolyspora erythraea]CAM01936.1 MerR-family transcriptional regulator [Saccharopolyspora erythraea NRRL 2338]